MTKRTAEIADRPGFTRFDVADHLNTPDDVAAYRAAAAENGDAALLARAEATIDSATAGRAKEVR